jgi:membrane-bound ClpP family serine protease
MATAHLSDDDLFKKLIAHPELRNRVESLLLAVEDEAGELKEADAAEMRVIEEMRRMGQEALQAWAARQVDKTSQELRQSDEPAWREGKKNCAGTPRSARSR